MESEPGSRQQLPEHSCCHRSCKSSSASYWGVVTKIHCLVSYMVGFYPGIGPRWWRAGLTPKSSEVNGNAVVGWQANGVPFVEWMQLGESGDWYEIWSFQVWLPTRTPELAQKWLETKDVWDSAETERSLLGAALISLKAELSGSEGATEPFSWGVLPPWREKKEGRPLVST